MYNIRRYFPCFIGYCDVSMTTSLFFMKRNKSPRKILKTMESRADPYGTPNKFLPMNYKNCLS